jgi:hypothetical protein
VIAIADQAVGRARECADALGIQHVHATVDELLAVHGAPDIVSAVVPVSQNFPVVAACVEAGVQVVSCEKPIHFSLEEADSLVELCRCRGTLFACGQCHWSHPLGTEVFDWVRAGNIGKVTSACIPGGCPREVSGGACPQLAAIRLLCGMEVSWVEGWVLAPEPTYDAVPEGRPAHEADCAAFGRLGFANGAVCTIPAPLQRDTAHRVPPAAASAQEEEEGGLPANLLLPPDGEGVMAALLKERRWAGRSLTLLLLLVVVVVGGRWLLCHRTHGSSRRLARWAQGRRDTGCCVSHLTRTRPLRGWTAGLRRLWPGQPTVPGRAGLQPSASARAVEPCPCVPSVVFQRPRCVCVRARVRACVACVLCHVMWWEPCLLNCEGRGRGRRWPRGGPLI